MSYITIVISIQLWIQQRTLKKVDRDKLIAYLKTLDIDAYYYNLQMCSLTQEQEILQELTIQDIWKEL